MARLTVVDDQQSHFKGPPAGRRARRRERVRRALLEAALAEFSAHGIYAARVEDITDRADLGKGAFYNYFESKVALVAALVREAVETLDHEYLARVDAALSPGRRAVAAAREHGAFFTDHPSYLLLLHQARGLILIEERQARQLQAAILDYLARVGRCVVGRAAPAGELIEQGAAVAGLVAGYRSFGLATARRLAPDTIEAFAAGGFPAVVARRRARRRRPAARRTRAALRHARTRTGGRR